MNVFSRYVAYLKNNPENYWFRRKVWGWGWVPATWQGWAALVAFVVALVAILVPFIRIPNPSNTDALWFIVRVAAWVFLLILVSYLTGEPPKWQWGFPEEE